MLGEASTKEIAVNKDAQGFVENKQAAFEGGAVAGNARNELERKSGKRVISKENYKKIASKQEIIEKRMTKFELNLRERNIPQRKPA